MSGTEVADRRRQLLQEQSELNGVDYVEVLSAPAGTPPQLRVVFVNPVDVVPGADQVRVGGGDRIRSVGVESVRATDRPNTLLVTLSGGGDLSPYELRLVRGPTDETPPDGIDPVLSAATFSFGVDCDTGLACEPENVCAPAALPEPRLDYLAKDWESFRAVLLDRMSTLQPGWTERNTADLRMVLLEALAERADRLAYRQDAITTEAYLGTARRRISVRRHARLIDYSMSDGTDARAWVSITVPEDVLLRATGGTAIIPQGTRFLTGPVDAPNLLTAGGDDEAAARRAGALEYQAISSLDVVAGAHCALLFHSWSGSRSTLPAGCTSATLVGHHPDLAAGQVLLLVEHRDPVGRFRAVEDADPTRRQAVRLDEVVAHRDAVPLTDALTGEEITEIRWHPGDALAFPLRFAGERATQAGGTEEYFDGALAVGNVVLVDQGRAEPEERLGPVTDNTKVVFRLAAGPLAQAPRQLLRRDRPDGTGSEDVLVLFDPAGSAASAVTGRSAAVLPHVALSDDVGPWTVGKDLLSGGGDRVVVVETDDEGVPWVRFGRAGTGSPAGAPPDEGQTFTARYRTGVGARGNVGAGSIRTILDGEDDEARIAGSLRAALAVAAGSSAGITNPLAATGGTDPESIEQVRQRAPFAFREQERAVTAADYAWRAAQLGRPQSAPVQRAVASIRWTGSWYTVVVAVDPAAGTTADPSLLGQVRDYLDQFRMAGHDLQVVGARYAPLEVGLAVRVEAGHRRDLVRAELMAVLSDRRRSDGTLGLFHPDRLTFGTSVYLGPILAAAQAIPGVERVVATRFSRYRQPGTDARATGRIDVGPQEIARLENNPSRPERGRFHLDELEGGR
jgi:Baseplate J-like protein